ncbi:MAG TPA: SDR family NAD(P)-dependent oxidoreductase [Fimbriiglobus sp.]|nr:SDR family NAD(P)-dependent oxidoreductase [Fimbriiglobus sp.]
MRRDLSGRVVLVTGASRGIGRRAAERLAREGVRLALTSRSGGELESLAKQLRDRGTEVDAFPADLTDAAAREGLVRDVVARFGGLDVLVNSAGVASFGEFATSSEDILRRVMEVNFFAAAEMIRLAQPHLLRSATNGPPGWRPAIVNVASICGRCGIPSLPEHCGSKHALVGLTEALRGEFTRYDIDVLLVLPGVVRSDDLNRHLLRNEGKIYLNFEGAQRPEEVGESVVWSLVKNRTETAVGFVSWWVWFGKRFFPRVPRWVMHWKAWRWARKHG